MRTSDDILQKLAIQYQNGDMTHENEFAEELKKMIRSIINFNSIIFTDCARDEEDFVQDVRIHVLIQLRRGMFNPAKASFKTWFTTVCTNYNYDKYMRYSDERSKELGKRKRRNEIEKIYINAADEDEGIHSAIENDEHLQTPSCEEEMMKKELFKALHEHIGELTPNQRRVIELELEGYAAEEISKIMQCSKDDVYRWKNRAITSLREALEADGFDRTE